MASFLSVFLFCINRGFRNCVEIHKFVSTFYLLVFVYHCLLQERVRACVCVWFTGGCIHAVCLCVVFKLIFMFLMFVVSSTGG